MASLTLLHQLIHTRHRGAQTQVHTPPHHPLSSMNALSCYLNPFIPTRSPIAFATTECALPPALSYVRSSPL